MLRTRVRTLAWPVLLVGILLVVALRPSPTQALDTHRVPQDYASIQDAIDAAIDGDVVRGGRAGVPIRRSSRMSSGYPPVNQTTPSL